MKDIVPLALLALLALLLTGPGCEESGADADIDVDTDTDVDADTDSDTGGTLEATASCTPSGDACALGAAENGALHASYRKDHYFTDEQYDEYTEYPVDGGRFHIAAVSAVSGRVTDVRIDGQSVGELLVEPLMEWHHVYPRDAVAAEPLWVAFHSRNPHWDSATSGRLVVQTDAGAAVDADFPVTQTTVPLTYVTITEDRQSYLIHLRNEGDAPRTLERLLLDGRDVLGTDVACAPSKTIAPGTATMIAVPACGEIAPGQAWTVVAAFDDGSESVGVGRVLAPFFPVESWVKGGECTFPTVNDVNYQRHRHAGIDTMYMYWGGHQECGYTGEAMVNSIAPQHEGFKVLIGDDFTSAARDGEDLSGAITDATAVAGFLTGDESDGSVYDDEGKPKAENKALAARVLWDWYPELTVYNGAMTNGNVGSFAGMTDVQGMDVYAGGCAPHITVWGKMPDFRQMYDYLRNARNNHMPLPTWLYAQGLAPGWNAEPPDGLVRMQPEPQEILAQALIVAAAGGKGLMWFQSSLEEADAVPDSWQAVSDANWMFHGVRSLLREGDVTGAARSDEQTLVEAIRSREAIVVPVISLATVEEGKPTDDLCMQATLGFEPAPHWRLQQRTVSVSVTVPADLAVAEVFEVLPGSTVEIPYRVDAAARSVTFDGLALSDDQPVRLLVLAASAGVRSAVTAAMSDAPH